ncbi:MAG: hypothetical protein A3F17_08350 [Gammaproteobacteria bacterium RIFCSPHIGHO2_12_FULL_41_15]|nr:MAG: hypothetical protein A3F17_08350 [Gammaproteobacteria bacterium RIFCSPHIGHO2_12_FULL_41_15]
MKKVYIANIPYSVTEDSLEALFAQCGRIESVNLIKDRETGRLRGFGFIEFDSEANAQAALKFDGHELDGRPLKVKIAEERRGGGRDGGRDGRDNNRRGGHSNRGAYNGGGDRDRW